ncbi:Coenzyme Q3 [Carabus blaptoides fortunei]
MLRSVPEKGFAVLDCLSNMAAVKSTLIDSEVEYFSNLSANWWTSLKGLEKQNKLRVPYIINSLVETGKISRETAKSGKPLTGIKILDVGCGGGFSTELLAELGAQVTGLDPSIKLIECAREHLKEREDIEDRVEYVHGTIETFCEQHIEHYDHVVAAEILEHIQVRDLFVKACVKTLKPGGTYFVSTINRTVKAWLHMILYLEYVVGSIPRGTHHWNLLVTPNETRSWIENADCTIVTINGWWQSADGEWQECDDTSTTYYMIAVKKYGQSSLLPK